MNSELDQFEKYIMDNAKTIYGETVIDHAMNPRNVGSLQDADGFARVTGPCGDTMEIWLRVKASKVQDATFWTDGCGTSIAAGSMATELAKGKNIARIQKTTQQDVLNALGGLPEESVHCALLAANTLKEAVRDYLTFQKEPWKRAYRNH